MALNPKGLADKINQALGVKDKDNKSIKTTKEMLLYASSIISAIKASAIFHPPGSITGPDSALMANNGTYLPPVNPAIWGSILAPVGPNTSIESVISTSYIQSASQLIFGVGDIQGINTAGSNPGPLANGRGSGGKITSLQASDWASRITTPFSGDPVLTKRVYQVIIDYLRENAELIYASGSVNGTFPAPGTSIQGGTGTGGLII